MSKEILDLKPERVWAHFYELTQIPRPTGHLDEVINFVVSFGEKLGLETKKDAAGNILIVKPASKGLETAPCVILQAHLDMVPQKNSDVQHDFLKDPIETHIVDGKVKARSTTLGADNGIGVASILAVLEDVTLEHGKIEALFTTDEEEGMDGAFGLQPGFLSGSIMLNLDTEEEGELCVGCAGGLDLNATFQYKDVPVEEGDVAIAIALKGLKGGHSGCDIHLGRANANKLLFRFLKEAVSDYEARLGSVSGGSLRNAIPREAFAVITVPEGGVDDVLALVAEYENTYREEYKATESNLSFSAQKTDLPDTLLPEEIQDNLINAVVGCQNGVISMLPDFEGTVEASSNLAFVKSSEGLVEVRFLVRSSSESRKYELASSIESVFILAGAKVEDVNGYPGWEPDVKSRTLAVMQKVYRDKFGVEPVVQVVHAGLECGIILSSTPGLDIVSFGPTIVNPHSPDEYVDIASVAKFYDYLVTTLKYLK